MWPKQVIETAFKGRKVESHVCVPVKFDKELC